MQQLIALLVAIMKLRISGPHLCAHPANQASIVWRALWPNQVQSIVMPLSSAQGELRSVIRTLTHILLDQLHQVSVQQATHALQAP